MEKTYEQKTHEWKDSQINKSQLQSENISEKVNYSEKIFNTNEVHETEETTDSLIPIKNLKFNSDIPSKKMGKPYNSEFVNPLLHQSEISNKSLFENKHKTLFDGTIDKSWLDKSNEWKMFRESQDNLEV